MQEMLILGGLFECILSVWGGYTKFECLFKREISNEKEVLGQISDLGQDQHGLSYFQVQ